MDDIFYIMGDVMFHIRSCLSPPTFMCTVLVLSFHQETYILRRQKKFLLDPSDYI